MLKVLAQVPCPQQREFFEEQPPACLNGAHVKRELESCCCVQALPVETASCMGPAARGEPLLLSCASPKEVNDQWRT